MAKRSILCSFTMVLITYLSMILDEDEDGEMISVRTEEELQAMLMSFEPNETINVILSK